MVHGRTPSTNLPPTELVHVESVLAGTRLLEAGVIGTRMYTPPLRILGPIRNGNLTLLGLRCAFLTGGGTAARGQERNEE